MRYCYDCAKWRRQCIIVFYSLNSNPTASYYGDTILLTRKSLTMLFSLLQMVYRFCDAEHTRSSPPLYDFFWHLIFLRLLNSFLIIISYHRQRLLRKFMAYGRLLLQSKPILRYISCAKRLLCSSDTEEHLTSTRISKNFTPVLPMPAAKNVFLLSLC